MLAHDEREGLPKDLPPGQMPAELAID